MPLAAFYNKPPYLVDFFTYVLYKNLSSYLIKNVIILASIRFHCTLGKHITQHWVSLFSSDKGE